MLQFTQSDFLNYIPMKNKIELLAPAGNYECFLAAVNAGADAVYLAGPRFGARAFADNFTQEQIIEAISYAHLFSVKVYLAINTLFKPSEANELIDFLSPIAEAKVDAVIIQDLGIAHLIKNHFPYLPLHASTQMCVTGPKAANLLKDFGFKRVILAREASLSDIAAISATGIEVEVFVHGAMCYCYSGQCLFSSMLGERSANRGRCAGPCRLPYTTENTDSPKHLLSLSDLCAIEYIPQLIQAGAVSFKIEGRLKPAPFVSAITAVYRKYIDEYLANPSNGIRLSTKDKAVLEEIYHRGNVNAGYLKSHGGHQNVTLDSPAYSKTDEKTLDYATKKYGNASRVLPIDIYGDFFIDRPMSLTLLYEDIAVTVEGALVEQAKKAPLDKSSISTQLNKLGDTPFRAGNIVVNNDENIFCTIGAIKELRRQGIKELEKAIIYHR